MRIEAISVIPQVFESYLDASIMGRAKRAGIFSFTAYDLRDWTHDRHRTVDDAPFGGGQGMLMNLRGVLLACGYALHAGRREPPFATRAASFRVRAL